MTDQDVKRLQEIRERCEKATAEPILMRYEHGGGRTYKELQPEDGGGRSLIADFYDIENREFYHSARTDIPFLLEMVDRVQKAMTQHAGDCTIYMPLSNEPEDGICTCGYGWSRVTNGDWSQMYSPERVQKETPSVDLDDSALREFQDLTEHGTMEPARRAIFKEVINHINDLRAKLAAVQKERAALKVACDRYSNAEILGETERCELDKLRAKLGQVNTQLGLNRNEKERLRARLAATKAREQELRKQLAAKDYEIFHDKAEIAELRKALEKYAAHVRLWPNDGDG